VGLVCQPFFDISGDVITTTLSAVLSLTIDHFTMMMHDFAGVVLNNQSTQKEVSNTLEKLTLWAFTCARLQDRARNA